MIHEVKVYGPSGKLQKVISQKALNKRSDKLCQDPFLYSKPAKGRKKKPSPVSQEPFLA
jgi:hypothetical protein|tara:strand:+ start:414 stop:590 length:177 start_codon:yes stop_codon:yes gene_type:complete